MKSIVRQQQSLRSLTFFVAVSPEMRVIPYENFNMLPLAVGTENKTNRYASVPAHPVNGEPLIFVVDDENSIRRFICVLLRHLTSAVVVQSGDPHTALAIARKMNRPIDLLISDIDLCAPMNGIDLARELSALNPSIRVLLISGADHPPCEIPRAWRFLPKPFHVDLFLNQISQLGHSVAPSADYFG
jgi:response regulator RpfG family c-di-GMP phosphodiesterase